MGGGGSFLPLWLDKSRPYVSLKRRKSVMMETVIVSSIDEEDSSARQGGQGVGHLADSGIVDESSKEQQETWKERKRGRCHSMSGPGSSPDMDSLLRVGPPDNKQIKLHILTAQQESTVTHKLCPTSKRQSWIFTTHIMHSNRNFTLSHKNQGSFSCRQSSATCLHHDASAPLLELHRAEMCHRQDNKHSLPHLI